MKKIVLSFFILMITAFLHAQTGTYLIPRNIYVGDRAALIIHLPAVTQNSDDIILTQNSFFPEEKKFPSDENIEFHRIILERRTAGSRLVIEFTAYAPGYLELPVIEIGEEYFSGLSVTVNSIINNRSDRVLSGTASTLAIPGTAFMLYGSMAALAFLILLIVWFIVKGRVLFRTFHEKWKRFRLFAGIKKTEKRLLKAINKGVDKRIILDSLSDETRNFLSVLTGSNCRSMTAREFDIWSCQIINPQITGFGKFFRKCDDLRFSGENIDPQDIMQLLIDLGNFTDELKKTKEKEKNPEEKTA